MRDKGTYLELLTRPIYLIFKFENYRLFYLNEYNISERKLSFILLLNAYLVHINNEVFNLTASYDDE